MSSVSLQRQGTSLPQLPPVMRSSESRVFQKFSSTKQREEEARRRLIKLQKELRRSRSVGAVEANRRRNLEKAREGKRAMDRLVGRDLSSMLQAVEPADEDEELSLSRLLNEKLSIFPDPNARSWYKLFRHIDDDGSGRVSYAELVDLLRNELNVSKKELPPDAFKRLWRTMDEDASGFITAGEFGHFMRKGEAEPGLTWKERRTARNLRKAASVKRELDGLVGRDVTKALALEPPASADVVQQLSEQLNAKMAIFPDPQTRSWFKLFKHMDDDGTRAARAIRPGAARCGARASSDALPPTPLPSPPLPSPGSGRISFAELEDMVRNELLIRPKELPDQQLKRLWRALDEDGSGFIAAGEFGAFMRKGEAMNSRTDLGGASLPQVYEARVAAKRSQLQAQEDMASLQAARRAADAVKRIEAEARRLEKALQKQRKLGAPPEPVRGTTRSSWDGEGFKAFSAVPAGVTRRAVEAQKRGIR